MKKHTIKATLPVCLLLWASAQASAQGLTPAAVELLKEQRLWSHTSNAAGTVFDDTRNYSDVTAGYDYTGGNFHRPQQGADEKQLKLSSEGFMNLGNAYAWGKFSFSQKNIDDAGFNASIADPYRGMPYYVADTHLSKWRNQYYDLSMRCATPIVWKRLAFGISGRYAATLAAKQRDPRVDTRFYTLELNPGMTIALGEKNSLGFVFEYASIKEDSRMDNVNTYVDQDYYELYGLGMARKGLGSGRTTNYTGDRSGFSMQYGLTTQALRLLLDAGLSRRVETVEISYLTPKKDAAIDEDKSHLSAELLVKGEKLTHHIKAEMAWSDADGIQYLNQRDNSSKQNGWMALYKSIRSTYKTQTKSIEYSLTRNRGNEYSWRVEAGACYNKINDTYVLPVSEKNAENVLLHLGAKLNQPLGSKLERRLLIGVRGGLSRNLSGSYTYGGPHADYPTVTELERLEEAFLTADFYNLGASATYSQQIRQGGKTHLFVKAGLDYAKTSASGYDHRSTASVAVGLNF